MGGDGTCTVHRFADDALELDHGSLPVVVHDGVVELRRERRLATAKEELAAQDEFDIVVTNDRLGDAADALERIVRAAL